MTPEMGAPEGVNSVTFAAAHLSIGLRQSDRPMSAPGRMALLASGGVDRAMKQVIAPACSSSVQISTLVAHLHFRGVTSPHRVKRADFHAGTACQHLPPCLSGLPFVSAVPIAGHLHSNRT